MKTQDLTVICSGIPGFIRCMSAALTGHCRRMECYSIAEAAQLIPLHRPQFLVADMRRAEKRQLDRVWALLANVSDCRGLIVVHSGTLNETAVPVEIAGRTAIIEQAADHDDLNAVCETVLKLLNDPAAIGTSPIPASAPSESPPETDTMAAVPSSDAPDSGTGSLPAGNTHTGQPNAGDGRISIVDRFRTNTPELRRMLERLQVAAQHDVTILLIGETGSGKTHLARLIHEASDRAKEAFLTVACGALPGDLIESELFGHTKGAFTSAHTDKDGKFLAAGRGTLLLDEIDVLTPEQQVKLLRVIETGQFEPVGSNTTLHVQARIIAASNLDLQPLVEQGRFRPDLYYRLNTLTFRIPPLRRRLPDIEPLARYFVHLHASRHGIGPLSITQDFLQALVSYPWPGNVREMENAIRSAVIYSQNGVLSAATLPPHIVSGVSGPTNDPSVLLPNADNRAATLGNRIELTEKDIIEQALLENRFSRTRTAKQLGISRVTLYNKMKKYNMMPER